MAMTGSRKLSPEGNNLQRLIEHFFIFPIGSLDTYIGNLIQNGKIDGQGPIGILFGGNFV